MKPNLREVAFRHVLQTVNVHKKKKKSIKFTPIKINYRKLNQFQSGCFLGQGLFFVLNWCAFLRIELRLNQGLNYQKISRIRLLLYCFALIKKKLGLFVE